MKNLIIDAALLAGVCSIAKPKPSNDALASAAVKYMTHGESCEPLPLTAMAMNTRRRPATPASRRGFRRAALRRGGSNSLC